MRRMLILSAVIPVTALVVAGCGSSNSSNSSNSSGSSGSSKSANASTTPATASKAAVIDLRSTSLGKVLVDGSGRTIYLFEKDKTPKTTCTGACATAWPPVTTTGTPTAGAGVSASMIKMVRGPDGNQVVYNGHPLYTYVGDSTAGQTTGEGLNQFGAEWYVLNSKGSKVEKEGS